MTGLKRFLFLPANAAHADLGLLALRCATGAFLIFQSHDNVFSQERMQEFVKFLTQFGFPLPELMAPLSVYAQFAAGIAFILGSLCDMFDGRYSRMSGKGTPFGAFLDSTLDRIEEGVVLAAVAWWFAEQGDEVAVGAIRHRGRRRGRRRRPERREHQGRGSQGQPSRGPAARGEDVQRARHRE